MGGKIVVPAKTPLSVNTILNPNLNSTSTTETNNLMVNINTADENQLDSLPGIGPATAKKIIDYRNTQGRFSTAEDLLNVKGIGEKKFAKLKSYITVN